ncbi:MAG: hypothetical protein LBF68_06490 [Christensenellaceae bacterium]|nr:hypothetical protein [Christensenellaceae bacterium]
MNIDGVSIVIYNESSIDRLRFNALATDPSKILVKKRYTLGSGYQLIIEALKTMQSPEKIDNLLLLYAILYQQHLLISIKNLRKYYCWWYY